MKIRTLFIAVAALTALPASAQTFRVPSVEDKRTGNVEFTDSNISAAIDLPWKLKLMKGKIQGALEGELDKLLAG